MRILLVEDEEEMAAALTHAFKSYDIATVVDRVTTLARGVEMAVARVHDVIVLDRGLPDGDGLTLIPKIRANGVRTAVIVLTARGELADRVAGLDVGADDYLRKPFAIEELLARLRALRRRPTELKSDVVRVGRLSFDLSHSQAEVDGHAMELPRRELLVLESLVRRAGRTVTRSSLEQAVYSFSEEVQSNALDTHVSRLRKKLTEAGSEVEIHGIRGVGYLLRRVS